MKKSLSTVFALLLLVASVVLPVNVFAASEADLLSKAKETVEVNGQKVRVKSEVLTQIERYLNQYDISDQDCGFIISKVDEAIKIAKSSKATSWNSLTASEKAQMISLAEEINNSTSVKATLTSDGKLTIYNEDGTVFTKLSDVLTKNSEVTSTDGASTSYTGVATTTGVIVIAIAAAGAVLVSKKVKTNA